MGMDINGSMIVGAHGRSLIVPESLSLCEFVESCGFDSLSEHYDADVGEQYYGFLVSDVTVDFIDHGWLDNVRTLAEKFTRLTGVPAMLIGAQDIT